MSDKIFPVKSSVAANAAITQSQYGALYAQSIDNPAAFWAKEAERLQWEKKWDKVKNTRFVPDVFIRWFEGGELNACVNCVDRHLEQNADKVAIIWEGDDPKNSRNITYKELHEQVCRLANVLIAQGVKKGDRVTLYMPMIPETAYAMLACARIGAVHSAVFGGFSVESLKGRIEDCKSDFIITADEGLRGGKTIPLKANVDAAIKALKSVRKVLVVKRTDGKVDWAGRPRLMVPRRDRARFCNP